MRGIIIFFTLLLTISTSCREKVYEDYNEEDFYEAQGIVINSYRTSSPFDGINSRSIEYIYHFDRKTPLKGFESDITDVRTLLGSPVVVLVLKDNPEISFFGYSGTLSEEDFIKGVKFLANDEEFRNRAGMD